MSPLTHRITALAAGTLAASQLGHDEVFVILGSFVGARAPDWLEAVHATKRRWKIPLFPHRTLTHWPWPWLMLAGWMLLSMPWWGQALLFGFAIAGLLHIALDFVTPMGIPFGNPFGTRFGLGWVRTGSWGELPLVLLCLALVALTMKPEFQGRLVSLLVK